MSQQLSLGLLAIAALAMVAFVPATPAGVVGHAIGFGAHATCSAGHAESGSVGYEVYANATAGGSTSSGTGPVVASASQVGLAPTSAFANGTTLGFKYNATVSCNLPPLPHPCKDLLGARKLSTSAAPDDSGTVVFSGAFRRDAQNDVHFVGTRNGAPFTQSFDANRKMEFNMLTTSHQVPEPLLFMECPPLEVRIDGTATERSSRLAFGPNVR